MDESGAAFIYAPFIAGKQGLARPASFMFRFDAVGIDGEEQFDGTEESVRLPAGTFEPV